MVARLFMLLFSVGLMNTAFSQVAWDLQKEKNGIKVYTSKENDSKFKDIKVEASLAGTVSKLIGILSNVGKTTGWVYGTKESYLIKKINDNEILYYSQTALPWPVSNRDIPIKMQLKEDTKSNSLKVYASGIPNAIPEKKGIVRIPFFNAFWDVKSEGKNRINITYILRMDPGGSVPSSVTNMFVSKGPFETFSNLSELLK
jgi:hypothetical protein